MTVSESIISWLKTFQPDNKKLRHIDTDLIHGNVDYALVKEPVTNIKTFISGTEVHTDHYQFYARMDAQTNSDNVKNGEWMELLSDWIRQQNREGNYPKLERAEVQEVGISTPFYRGQTNDHKAIYQLTIFIRYMKRGETK